MKARLARSVHQSTSTLLAVPQYADLLEDQDDEDEGERGRMLINSRQGWRTEMAKWIGDARDTEAVEDFDGDDNDGDGDSDIIPPLATSARSNGRTCPFEWKHTPLAVLFGGRKPPS